MHALFAPRNVAIIGASANPDKLGGKPIHFLKKLGYPGTILPINPRGGEVQGLKAYTSLAEIEEDIDHAIIIVPAAATEAALADCVKKGIPFAQILSSGFAEAGEEGRAAQDRLVEIARAGNIRFTGPNALGCVSPGAKFFGTFSTALNGLMPVPGPVAVATQSGAFGSCTYVMASLRGIGLSRIIATGNEADIDVADVIDFLADDDETKVICAAIESCQNGTKLRKALVKAATNRKPVIVMKVGASEIGAAAAMTHTGALAGNDVIYDAIFKECGAYRAQSIEDMIDLAYVLSIGGIPDNAEAAILTVSGGIGILLADAATAAGVELTPFSTEDLAALTRIIPFAAGNNPLDTTAQVTQLPNACGEAGEYILSQTAHGTLFLYLANNALSPAAFDVMRRDLLQMRRRQPDKLIVTIMPSDPSLRAELEAAGILVFEDPSRAVRAVSRAARFQPMWNSVQPVASIEKGGRQPWPSSLNEAEAKALLSEAGMPVSPERICKSAQEAVEAALELGLPVAMKILSPDILHKSEAGGIALGLADEQAVRSAYDRIIADVGALRGDARIDGVLVSPMAPRGLEVILGVQNDPVFGPVIMFGPGGILVELLKDVSFASVPVARERVEDLLNEAAWSRLLDGWRGDEPLDRDALIDCVCCLSDFAARNADRIRGLEVNPLLVTARGCVMLDAVLDIEPDI